jgi:hypothetical protein
MTAFSLIGFACIVSGWAIYKKETVIAIIASAIWLACIAYTRANPLGSMVTGDTSDTAVLLALIGLMVLVPIISFRLNKKEERETVEQGLLKEESNKTNTQRMSENSSTKVRRENSDDYYDRLNRLTHPKK